jgi:hypothetical protein
LMRTMMRTQRAGNGARSLDNRTTGKLLALSGTVPVQHAVQEQCSSILIRRYDDDSPAVSYDIGSISSRHLVRASHAIGFAYEYRVTAAKHERKKKFSEKKVPTHRQPRPGLSYARPPSSKC